jgi:hypothetical protein
MEKHRYMSDCDGLGSSSGYGDIFGHGKGCGSGHGMGFRYGEGAEDILYTIDDCDGRKVDGYGNGMASGSGFGFEEGSGFGKALVLRSFEGILGTGSSLGSG